LKFLAEDYEKMHKFKNKVKSSIEKKKQLLALKLNEARESQNFILEKFQELLKDNNKYDNNHNLSQQINYFLHTEIDERIQNNQKTEESIIIGKNLFNDINCVREKIDNKINIVNKKQQEINFKEKLIEIKFCELSEDQKNILTDLLNTQKYDYITLNNNFNNIYFNNTNNNNTGSNSYGNNQNNYISNLNSNNNNYLNSDKNDKFQDKTKSDINNTNNNNLLGEISRIFKKLKKENFFEKICETEILMKNNITQIKFENPHQINHLITDPISFRNSNIPFNNYKNTQNNDNTIKIIDKELNNNKSKKYIPICNSNSALNSNYLNIDNKKINLIFENDYYEKEFSEDEFFNNNNDKLINNIKKKSNKNNLRESNEYNNEISKYKKNNFFLEDKKNQIFNKFYNKINDNENDNLPNIPFILKYYSNLLIPFEEKNYFSDEIEYHKKKLGGYLKCNYPLEYYESTNKVQNLMYKSSSNSNFLFNRNLISNNNNLSLKDIMKNNIKNLDKENETNYKKDNKSNHKINSYKSKENMSSRGNSSERIRPRYNDNRMKNDGNAFDENKNNSMRFKRKSLDLSRISEIISPKKKAKKKKLTKSLLLNNNTKSYDINKKSNEKQITNITRIDKVKFLGLKNENSILTNNLKINNKNSIDSRHINKEPKTRVLAKEINLNKPKILKEINLRKKNIQLELEIDEPDLIESNNLDSYLKNKKKDLKKNYTKNISSINNRNCKIHSNNKSKSNSNTIRGETSVSKEKLNNINFKKINPDNSNSYRIQKNLIDLDESEIEMIANASATKLTDNVKKTNLDISADNFFTMQKQIFDNSINLNMDCSYDLLNINKENTINKENSTNTTNNKISSNLKISRNKSERLLVNIKNNDLNKLENSCKIKSFSNTTRFSNSKSTTHKNNIHSVNFDFNENNYFNNYNLKDIIIREKLGKKKKGIFKNKAFFDKKAEIRNEYKKPPRANEENNQQIFIISSNNNIYPTVKFDNYSYIKSRYEFLNKHKKNEEEQDLGFDPNIHKIEMRINYTTVKDKQENFGIKTIKRIKGNNKKYILDEIQINENQSLIRSKLFLNESKNKKLRSKLFVSDILNK